jgi:hypothetical protein
MVAVAGEGGGEGGGGRQWLAVEILARALEEEDTRRKKVCGAFL